MSEGREQDVAAALEALRHQVDACQLCRLHQTRTQAVFGEGDPGSRLMFVGEAPGYHEDKHGRPFVGAAGKLLEDLLAGIGLRRDQVFIANVLKSRPPDNRDPLPDEIAACTPWLRQQIAIIRPAVICSLGNFATKYLSDNPMGISRVHGRPLVKDVEGHLFHLYPLYHPAAALYTPSMLQTLRDDFSRIPALIAAPPVGGRNGADGLADLSERAASRSAHPPGGSGSAPPCPLPAAEPVADPDEQLGLF